jgi:D-methionine transport system substrate-binding protein
MKKLLALLFALTMILALAACGGTTAEAPAEAEETETAEAAETEATAEETTGETVTLRVGASPTPHAEVLAQVKDDLAEQGIDLQIVEYTDYVVPNTAVEDGEDDANYFQHTPYMNNFNAERGTHLVAVGDIHYEPMGIYAGQTKSLEELPDGATIAVPNDATNEGRALLLLQAQGLITIDEAAGLECTPNDITENPKNLVFKELEAAMLPQTIDEVNLSVINSNYALQAGFNPVQDSLAMETADTTPYPNVIAVKEGNENNEAIQALVKALQSDKVRDYIEETYGGAVVALF